MNNIKDKELSIDGKFSENEILINRKKSNENVSSATSETSKKKKIKSRKIDSCLSKETEKSQKVNSEKNVNFQKSIKKNKDLSFNYYKKSFRSTTFLNEEIDKFLKKFDNIFLLRSFREEIKNIKEFNNVKKILEKNKKNNCRIEFIFESDNTQITQQFENQKLDEKIYLNYERNKLKNYRILTEEEKFFLENNIDKFGINLIFNSGDKNFNDYAITIDAGETQTQLENMEKKKDEEEDENIIKQNSCQENFKLDLKSSPINKGKISESNLNKTNTSHKSKTRKNCTIKKINLLAQNHEREILNQLTNKYISPSSIINVDVLILKIKSDYYSNINDVLKDIIFLFKYISANLEKYIPENEPEETIEEFREYLNTLYFLIMEKILSLEKTFKEFFKEDLQNIFETNNLPKKKNEKRIPPVKKEYEILTNYEYIEGTEEKVLTKLKPNCQGKCCYSYDLLGPLNLEKSKWDGNCCDRQQNIECNPEICGCDPNICKNQDIRKQLDKKIEKDVEWRYSWGIDLFSYRNYIEILPNNFSEAYKSFEFIEKKLIRSLTYQEKEGYKIKKSLQQIKSTFYKSLRKKIISDIKSTLYIFETFINLDEENDLPDKYQREINYTLNDYYLSNHLTNIFNLFPYVDKICGEAYSKGIGIYCLRENGIKMNEYIAGYFGEVYPPWYWFEKQDLIKSNKLVTDLPDFYNIMLERHKFDEDGYDILMVDPNSKGNFASRMSHSCLPNCNTVLMVSDKKYTIGMFATKNISFGEELTFDYNSVTEKEQEFKDAICLCSTFSCRGYYLILSKSMVFSDILNKYHNFLHRNALLLNACFYNDQNHLDENEVKILNTYSIKNSILKKAPFWLKKWCVLILKFIDLEAKLLPFYLFKMNNPENFNGDEKKIYDFGLHSTQEKSCVKIRSSKKLEKNNFKNNNNTTDKKQIDFIYQMKMKLEKNKKLDPLNKDISTFIKQDFVKLNKIKSSIFENSRIVSANDLNSKIQKQNSNIKKNKNHYNNDIYFYPDGVNKYKSSTRGKSQEIRDVSFLETNNVNLNLNEDPNEKQETSQLLKDKVFEEDLFDQEINLQMIKKIEKSDIKDDLKSKSDKKIFEVINVKKPQTPIINFENYTNMNEIDTSKFSKQYELNEKNKYFKEETKRNIIKNNQLEYDEIFNRDFGHLENISRSLSINKLTKYLIKNLQEKKNMNFLNRKRYFDKQYIIPIKSINFLNKNLAKIVPNSCLPIKSKSPTNKTNLTKSNKHSQNSVSGEFDIGSNFYINLKDSDQSITPKNFANKEKTSSNFDDCPSGNFNEIKSYIAEFTKLSKVPIKDILESREFKESGLNSNSITESRIQNLVITLNKIIHVLGKYNDDKPPLIKLNNKEIILNLWYSENSLKRILLQKLKKLHNLLYRENLFENLDEIKFILFILEENCIDLENLENFIEEKNENIHMRNLIKICNSFIKENLKDDQLIKDFYHSEYDKAKLEEIDTNNSKGNPYFLSFKDFVEKNEKNFVDSSIFKEENFYWINNKKFIVPEKMNSNNVTVYNEFKDNHIDSKLEELKNEIYFNKNNKIKENKKNFSDQDYLKILNNLTENEINDMLIKIKDTFKFIALVFYICHFKDLKMNTSEHSRKYVFYLALADMIFMHSFTEIYFKHNEVYDKQVNSCKISILDRDVNVADEEDHIKLDSKICEGSKVYDKLYIWGQLIGWFKQTVDKPNASLSGDRRGSLAYPELDCFFYDENSNVNNAYRKISNKRNDPEYKNFKKVFEYPFKSREKFFCKIAENPYTMWPVGNEWSFKNRRKIYGSIQFDSIIKSGIMNPQENSERKIICKIFEKILSFPNQFDI